MDEPILIVGGNGLVAKAARVGARAVMIQRPSEYNAEEVRQAELVALADYRDVSTTVRVAETLNKLFRFGAVFTVEEEAVFATAAIARSLGLPGTTPRTVRLLGDKWAMRRHLNSVGISETVSRIGSQPSDLHVFAEDAGFPFIVKPIAGTCSYGAFRISEAQEISLVWSRLSKMRLRNFLMEEYLDGPGASFECFSFRGRHVWLTTTDQKSSRSLMLTGDSMPSIMPPFLLAEGFRMVSSFLDSVGLTDGASHTEVKFTAAGPKIVEGHCRRGGGPINDMMNIAYGIDMEELGLAWATGQANELLKSPEATGGVAVRYFEANPGMLRAIEGYNELASHSDIVGSFIRYNVGDLIPPLRYSLDRAGYVMVRKNTVQEAIAAAEAYAKNVRFDVIPPLLDRVGSELDLAELAAIDQAALFGY